MKKKDKIIIIISILIALLGIGIYFGVKYFLDKDLEKLEQELQETKEKFGTIEEITVDELVTRFNTQVIKDGVFNPANDEYLAIEDNIYWYGLITGIYLGIVPEEFNNDPKTEIVDHTFIYTTKDSQPEEASIEYIKFLIKANNENVTDEEIDNLLERVFNIFSSGMELGAELELFAAKPTGGSTELVLTTGKANIGEESFNTFQNVTQLLTNTLKYDIAKSLGSGSTEMELRTAPASTLKEALEKFKNTMLLDSDASTSAITHGEAETDMVLTTNDFDIFYMLSVEGEAMMNLLFSADFEMWYTLGTGDSSMCLTVENSGVQSKKFMTYESFLNLVLEIGNILQCFIFPDESGSLLSSELNIGMKRHRLLSEMDNLTLSEHDDITLEELDYVILA